MYMTLLSTLTRAKRERNVSKRNLCSKYVTDILFGGKGEKKLIISFHKRRKKKKINISLNKTKTKQSVSDNLDILQIFIRKFAAGDTNHKTLESHKHFTIEQIKWGDYHRYLYRASEAPNIQTGGGKHSCPYFSSYVYLSELLLLVVFLL